jgi:hypothetical protein
MEYREVAMRTLIVIPLSVLLVTLAGGGHAPLILMLPALFLFGPLGFLAPTSGLSGFFFAIFGPYPLYLLYGLAFAFLSGTRPIACRAFLVSAFLVQVGAGIFALIVKFT